MALFFVAPVCDRRARRGLIYAGLKAGSTRAGAFFERRYSACCARFHTEKGSRAEGRALPYLKLIVLRAMLVSFTTRVLS